MQFELAGMKGQAVEVSLDADHLVIEGERAAAEDCKEVPAYYCERPFGAFHRVVHLPCSVSEEGASARYEDGVLTVRLPKATTGTARRIEIA